jgi:DNA (cytosine-5)-methyltransferase 1
VLTFGDLCSGGGGASLGAIAAGLTPVFAIEHDADIAACYRRNVGDHVIVGDVATVNIAALPRVDVLWGSFPCQDSSVARSKKLAPRSDGNLALCVLDYARILRPAVIVMENVPPWRRTPVYRQVMSGLSALGYFVDGQLVDASRFGVPQTRRRCIVRAVLGGLVPALPAPSARIGWYAALKDLLPGLPESRFAPWQLKRLGPLFQNALVEQGNAGRESTIVPAAEPSVTVQAWHGGRPAHMPRAFIVHNQISQSTDAPMVREADDPSLIVTTNSGGRVRAWLTQGRVVALTPRCLARLQTFPDSYELPSNKALAGRIVGNAVPPELGRRILAGLRHCIQEQEKEIA